MKLKALFLFLSLFALTAEANFFERLFGGGRRDREEQQAPASSSEVTSADQNAPADPNAPDVLVVIDRNPAKQTTQVYLEGRPYPSHTFPASTGRETYDTPTNFKRAPYCSTTPKGEFSPQLLRELNKSNTWLTKDATGNYTDGSAMWHSIFFNGGIATHRSGYGPANPDVPETGDPATAAVDPRLGPKSLTYEERQRTGNPTLTEAGSGGCIRLAPDAAKTLFDLIARKDANGNYMKSDPRQEPFCVSNPSNGRCADPLQWPVRMKRQTVKFKVVDSRPQAEQDAVEKRCNEQAAVYQRNKALCLKNRLLANPALQALNAQGRFDYERELSALSSNTRSEYNESCNREIYERTHVVPPTNLQAQNQNPQTTR